VTSSAGSILVESDLTKSSDEAIREADRRARDAGVGLVVCHVLPALLQARPLFPHLRQEDRAAAEELAKRAADALHEQVLRVLGPEVRMPELRLEAGTRHSVVLQLADEIGASLIVLASTAKREHARLGSAGERVARHAQCPVLIASLRRGRVVVAATDFSDPALPAVRLGEEEAIRDGRELVIVHAIDLHSFRLGLPEIVSASTIERVMEQQRAEAQERLDALAKTLRRPARLLLREGPAADEIVAVAKEVRAGLLVLGTRGHSALRRLALGSVAESVLRRAPCSTLVVRLGP